MQEYRPEKSAHVILVQYDEPSQEMHVTFKGNPKPYTHVGVPQKHFDAMKKDISAGSYYWQRIVRFFPRKKEIPNERSTTIAPA